MQILWYQDTSKIATDETFKEYHRLVVHLATSFCRQWPIDKACDKSSKSFGFQAAFNVPGWKCNVHLPTAFCINEGLVLDFFRFVDSKKSPTCVMCLSLVVLHDKQQNVLT